MSLANAGRAEPDSTSSAYFHREQKNCPILWISRWRIETHLFCPLQRFQIRIVDNCALENALCGRCKRTNCGESLHLRADGGSDYHQVSLPRSLTHSLTCKLFQRVCSNCFCTEIKLNSVGLTRSGSDIPGSLFRISLLTSFLDSENSAGWSFSHRDLVGSRTFCELLNAGVG